VTPLDLTSLENLVAVDEDYSRRHSLATVVDRASIHYYQRSGHSFVVTTQRAASGDDDLLGFVLAHASWSGGRPVVRVERLATVAGAAAGAAAAAAALVEAVVKSAYDAGVYDISAAVPNGDGLATTALGGASFGPSDTSIYVRVLGSRAAQTHRGG